MLAKSDDHFRYAFDVHNGELAALRFVDKLVECNVVLGLVVSSFHDLERILPVHVLMGLLSLPFAT